MQTTVQKQKSVRFGSGVCEVYNGADWVNIGMISDAEMSIAKTIKQFIGANAKLAPKSRITEAKFNFNLYEIDLSTIKFINGDAVYTTTNATAVSITGEALGTGLTKGKPVKLKNKNGDSTQVANIKVYSDGTELTLDTDYSVYVDNSGYTEITPLDDNSGVITADYDYTPYASKTIELGDADQMLNLQGFRFTNTDTEGKIFRVEILKGYNAEGMTISFKGDEDEEPANMPVSITAFPDDTQGGTSNLIKIYDEQSVV